MYQDFRCRIVVDFCRNKYFCFLESRTKVVISIISKTEASNAFFVDFFFQSDVNLGLKISNQMSANEINLLVSFDSWHKSKSLCAQYLGYFIIIMKVLQPTDVHSQPSLSYFTNEWPFDMKYVEPESSGIFLLNISRCESSVKCEMQNLPIAANC